MATNSVAVTRAAYQCKSCELEKGVNDFYVSNQSTCKECVKAGVRKNRAENIDYYRSYDRLRYRESDERKAHCQAMGKSIPMSVRVERQRERRRSDDGLRSNARQKVSRAIGKGQSKKHTNCFFCDSTDSLQAHHHDYSKPLDVFWLCAKCHGKLHTVTGDFHRDKPEF